MFPCNAYRYYYERSETEEKLSPQNLHYYFCSSEHNSSSSPSSTLSSFFLFYFLLRTLSKDLNIFCPFNTVSFLCLFRRLCMYPRSVIILIWCSQLFQTLSAPLHCFVLQTANFLDFTVHVFASSQCICLLTLWLSPVLDHQVFPPCDYFCSLLLHGHCTDCYKGLHLLNSQNILGICSLTRPTF